MTTITTEETGAAAATAQPKAAKKTRVAPRSAHVAPKKGKSGKKASPPKKAPKGGKKALNGRDLRSLPLMERKNILRRVVNKQQRILYARHFDQNGCDLFRLVCEQDLEGIVAKRRDAAYGEDWFKIRNPKYSQYEGRQELYEGGVYRLSIVLRVSR